MSATSRKIRGLAFGICATIALLALPHAAGAQAQPIQACVNRKNKIQKILQPGQTCSSKQTSLSWNTQGPAGPQGPAGTPGTAGTPGDNLALLTGTGFAGIDDANAGSTVYFGPGNGESWSDANFSLPSESVPLPAGTLSNLQVALDAPPGTGEIDTFTVCKNESCTTAVTCQISDTARTCNSGTATVVISAGDRVALRESGSDANANLAHVSWSINLEVTQ
jgi:hypothetical protein